MHEVEAEVFHADGRGDVMKLVFAFHNFANAPKENSQYGCQITRFLQVSEHSF
jgi:hypothetical protein